MFETRTFDVEKLKICKINRINNEFLEEYSCYVGTEKCFFLIGITTAQQEYIAKLLDFAIQNEDIVICNKSIDVLGYRYQYMILNIGTGYSTIVDYFPFKIFKRIIQVKKSLIHIEDLIKKYPFIDFAYNRMDFNFNEYSTLEVIDNERSFYVPYSIVGEKLYLGASIVPIDTRMLQSIIKWVKDNEISVKQMEIMFSLAYHKDLNARNNFAIMFPKSFEEMLLRVKKKTAGNVRREWSYFERDIGKLNCIHYKKEEISNELVGLYFDMKKETHSCDYGMDEKTYLNKYYVTDAYTLETDNEICAILFSCEQSRIAYLENFSYKKEYAHYSLGTILYWKYLECLIKKGKKAIYLAGGSYEYKKHFDSFNMLCFSGEIVVQ